MDAGLVVGIFALVLAVIGLLGERAKRPRLAIRSARWAGAGEFPWHFLVIRVFNRPLPGWIGWLFARDSADGCQISLTFFYEGDSEAAIDQIPGRWSAAPEPINWLPTPPIPDPARVPDSYRFNVPAGEVGEEVAVARSLNGEAYAFSAESYLHPNWRRPGWELRPGRWRVVVQGGSSNANARETLSIEVSETGNLNWSGLG